MAVWRQDFEHLICLSFMELFSLPCTQARLPLDATDAVEEDPTGAKAFWSRGLLNGAPQKLEILNNFYVGETILSLQKGVLTAGGKDCVVYTTMSGAIGVLVPFLTKEEFEFFQALEMHLRQEHPPLCGRDHLAYRSFYFPCKVRIARRVDE